MVTDGGGNSDGGMMMLTVINYGVTEAVYL